MDTENSSDKKTMDKQERLDDLKNNVRNAHDYFKNNYDMYAKAKKFVCETTLTPADLEMCEAVNRPIASFNTTDPYLSRQLGEFYKQDFSYSATNSDSTQPVNPELIDFVEGKARHILDAMKQKGIDWRLYKDMLEGGFTGAEVYHEYMGEESFDQEIGVRRVYEPLLMGFDPMANEAGKQDGGFIYYLMPLKLKRLKELYDDIDETKLDFSGSLENFSWCYKVGDEKIVLLCYYFEKKMRRVKIVKLANGMTQEKKKYEEYLEQWAAAGHVAQPAAIVKERWTTKQSIKRIEFIASQVLDEQDTIFPSFPEVFGAGRSEKLMDPGTYSVKDFCQPYAYNAFDAQRLKNLAGQTLMGWIEKMVMHKYLIAKEAIPEEEDWQKAYQNPQVANNIVYNSLDHWDVSGNSPPVPIPAPQAITPAALPPEIMAAFTGADALMQACMGSYDTHPTNNDQTLSGRAILMGTTNNNSTAMPFIMGYGLMMEQICQIIVDLIPEIYVSKRDVPIIDKDGKHKMQKVNDDDDPSALKIDYKKGQLKIAMKVSASYSIEKNHALELLINLSKSFPTIGQFLSEAGLPVIFDNLDMRGLDKMKELFEQWQGQQAQKQQQQMQQQMQMMQMNPQYIKAQADAKKVPIEIMKAQTDAEYKAKTADIDKQRADTEHLEVMLAAAADADKLELEYGKHEHGVAKDSIETVRGLDEHNMNMLAQHAGLHEPKVK